MAALYERITTCNGAYQIFENTIKGQTQLVLKNGRIIEHNQVAERLLIQHT
ncbi:MAG: hypothetical protein M3O71_10235 [Bacteroidota bacterium]|nr:hypothetical protein [Bacteroidota bacterium]